MEWGERVGRVKVCEREKDREGIGRDRRCEIEEETLKYTYLNLLVLSLLYPHQL